ncbi:MAG: hypothetical protein ACQCXQ_06275 [Verrucomicrobiales bacterium]|nr:hypothetical protein [Verrucomicrobiota bacterium JB025]
MTTHFKKRLILAFTTLTLPLAAGPIVNVTSTKGKVLVAELISVSDKKVTVRRASDKKVFTIPKTSIDPESLSKIETTAKDLPTPVPDLEIEVVVNKRRKKLDSYLVEQTLSTTVKIRNSDLKLPLAGAKGHIFLIGQNKKAPDLLRVLSTSSFDINLKSSENLAHPTPEVVTKYDSDREGYGNIGGYQYEGYVFLLFADDGSVITTKSSDSNFRSALENDINLPTRMLDYTVDTHVDKNLLPITG